eukprot:768221-Hanusia_phi.AAC.14
MSAIQFSCNGLIDRQFCAVQDSNTPPPSSTDPSPPRPPDPAVTLIPVAEGGVHNATAAQGEPGTTPLSKTTSSESSTAASTSTNATDSSLLWVWLTSLIIVVVTVSVLFGFLYSRGYVRSARLHDDGGLGIFNIFRHHGAGESRHSPSLREQERRMIEDSLHGASSQSQPHNVQQVDPFSTESLDWATLESILRIASLHTDQTALGSVVPPVPQVHPSRCARASGVLILVGLQEAAASFSRGWRPASRHLHGRHHEEQVDPGARTWAPGDAFPPLVAERPLTMDSRERRSAQRHDVAVGGAEACEENEEARVSERALLVRISMRPRRRVRMAAADFWIVAARSRKRSLVLRCPV